MRGVLQRDKGARPPPAGATAEVSIRVVGRNTKGPLGTVQLPLDGATFPLEYTVTTANLREGVPDFLWKSEDIYVKADILRADGKSVAEGRSKAKARPQPDGSVARDTAYLLLE